MCDTAGGDWVDGRVDDDGVKDGLRPLEEPEDSAWPEAADDEDEDEDERSLTLVPAAALSLAWPGAFESLLDERANQLFVAAIACLTAWRPVSSTPLPEPALSARRVSSGFSGDVASAAAEPAPVRDEPAPVRGEAAPVRAEPAPAPGPAPVEPEPAPVAPAPAVARKPAAGVFEPFGFPISSAGNGTGAWLDLPAPPRAPEPGLSAPPDPGASAEREAEEEGEGEEEEGEEEEGEEEEADDEAASSGPESAPF